MMTVNPGRIACLDGLRGLAALWVLIGHTLLLTNWGVPIASEPDLGVDLFIMLSGFLMVFHYQHHEWARTGTAVSFWARRFFRIAPLFYVMLVVALLLGPQMYAARLEIDSLRGVTPQSPERYLDGGIDNIMMHVTFLFGMVPHYAFRDPLPDWSLGLEMQFYLLFPLMMMLIKRVGWARGALLIVGASIGGAFVARGLHIVFPMPSFLPLKMHVFVCGMLCAVALERERRFALLATVAGMVLIALPIGGDHALSKVLAREIILLSFYGLILQQRLIGGRGGLFLARASTGLGGRPFHWLGELSYSAYLIHLIVLQLVAGSLVAIYGTEITSPLRFLIGASIVLIVTYGLSYVTYTQIERRGIRLGALILRRLGVSKAQAVPSPAEQIAVP